MGRVVIVDDDPVVEHAFVGLVAQARSVEEHPGYGVAVTRRDLARQPLDGGLHRCGQLLRDERAECGQGGKGGGSDSLTP